jgi:hypothetical protein
VSGPNELELGLWDGRSTDLVPPPDVEVEVDVEADVEVEVVA